MAERPHHPTDALQDAIDGRLNATERAALDAHLSVCQACRRELEALSWVKRQIADPARTGVPIPADLEAGILRALDAEDRAMTPPRPSGATTRRGVPRRAWIGWAAVAAAVVALVWVGSRPSGPSVPTQVAADFRTYLSGSFALDLQTSDPETLQARLQAAGLSFPIRVFDFGMMDYRLAGGGVHRVAGRPSALFAYEGSGTLRLLCQMYDGTVVDLPPPAERRTNNGIEFLMYREGDVTVVFWQEGSVVCVLAANGDAGAAIKLAYAKAVRV